MSDYHPDTWNPAWSIDSILKGLLSFMLESTATAGSITTTTAQKQRFATLSGSHNLRSAKFVEIFPGMADRIKSELSASSRGCPDVPEHSAAPVATAPADSLVGNLVVLVAVAAFVLLAMHIISENDEEL